MDELGHHEVFTPCWARRKSVASVDVIAEGTCIVILGGCRDLDDEGTGGGNKLDGEIVETSGPLCGPIVGNVCFWLLRLLLFFVRFVL